MTATSRATPARFLMLKRSERRDAAGRMVGVVTLTDTGSKLWHSFEAEDNGTGWDAVAVALGKWLEASHPDRLAKIADRASAWKADKRTTIHARPEGATLPALAGLVWWPETCRAIVDGREGLPAVRAIAEAAGLHLRDLFDHAGTLGGFDVEDASATPTCGAATIRRSEDARFGRWFVQVLRVDVEGFATHADALRSVNEINVKTYGMTDAEIRAAYKLGGAQ